MRQTYLNAIIGIGILTIGIAIVSMRKPTTFELDCANQACDDWVVLHPDMFVDEAIVKIGEYRRRLSRAGWNCLPPIRDQRRDIRFQCVDPQRKDNISSITLIVYPVRAERFKLRTYLLNNSRFAIEETDAAVDTLRTILDVFNR